MARPILDLFCEDIGHEQFANALLHKIAQEVGLGIRVRTVSSRGGKPRAISELKSYQLAISSGNLARSVPDLLVVVIDGNCSTFNESIVDVTTAIDTTTFPRYVVGCPDPHIERWCFADSSAFARVVGESPPSDPHKCERDLYKRLLRDIITRAGHPVLTDAMEFAPEIVQSMDSYRAGKTQPSLKHFIDGIRDGLQQLQQLT